MSRASGGEYVTEAGGNTSEKARQAREQSAIMEIDTAPSVRQARKQGGAGEAGAVARRWAGGVRLESMANLAHELRTPVHVLLGYLDLLRQEWSDALGAGGRRIVERMELNAHELAQTLENLLELATAEAGGRVVVAELVDVGELMAELGRVLAAANQRRGLRLNFELDQAPATLYCDRRMLRSIIANLALNAIKFTSAGSVTVAIRRAKGESGRGRVEVEVRDTGPGLDSGMLERAFEPFAQLSASSSRLYRGLGLGLALVRRNVAELGGTLEVVSSAGRGSSFVVRMLVGGAGAAAV